MYPENDGKVEHRLLNLFPEPLFGVKVLRLDPTIFFNTQYFKQVAI